MITPAHYQTIEFELVKQLVATRVMNREEPLRVVDFGCGRGKYLSIFLSHQCSVIAVDTNERYVADAADRGVAACSPTQFLADTTRQYDLIFLSHVIEHLAPETLVDLIPRLCRLLAPEGILVLVSPTPGERFYHDFSHVRPYLPQSIRHAFGQTGAPLSYGEMSIVELIDIHFFRDPFRTRTWRSYYFGHGVLRAFTVAINKCFDIAWSMSGGRIGVVASWLGIYRLKK